MRKDIPIRVWYERIDTLMFAAIALCREEKRGAIYGRATFMLLDRSNSHDWRDIVTERLQREINTGGLHYWGIADGIH